MSGDDADRLAAYVKVARVLRERIRSGKWTVGQMLPSLSELCEEFDASRNTVRQALHVLATDRLIDHSRGRRAVVVGRPTSAEDLPQLVAAINDPGSGPTSIEILEQRIVDRPPDDLTATSLLFDSYQFLRKLHRLGQTPYVLSDFFIARRIFETFAGAETRVKIDQLLRQQDRVRLELKRQTVSIVHADAEVAALLNCELGETVVAVRRKWEGTTGRLLCAARSLYLGKFFVFETVERIGQRNRKAEVVAAKSVGGI